MKPAEAAEVSALVEKLKRGELSAVEFMKKAAPDLSEEFEEAAIRSESVGDERAGLALRKIRSL